MDRNISERIEQKMVRQSRFQVIHRWTDMEVNRLLESILNYLKMEPTTFFECPTAKRFYEKLRKDYFTEGDFDLIALKSKMRHLRQSYIKARDWEKNVGSEMYMSDQNYVNTTKKKICPFYDLLDKIFNANLNEDSKAIHSNENTTNFLKKSIKKHMKNTERTEETNYADNIEESSDENLDTTTNNEKEPNSFMRRKSISTPSIEEKRFQLKKQKFKMHCKFEARRLNLENRKLKYEKEKFQREQEIHEYEIRKQNEIKKLEIETNQRLRLLENGLILANQECNENEEIMTDNFKFEKLENETEDF